MRRKYCDWTWSGINKEYESLLAVAKDFQDKYNNEYTAHENTKVKLNDITDKKNKWVKATFITGGTSLLIIAPLVYLLIHSPLQQHPFQCM